MIKRTIWDANEDYEEWLEDLRIEYPDYSDEELLDLARDMHDEYLDDERMNLDKELDGEIVVFAQLGLWYGAKPAYKELHSSNVKDILYSQVNGESYCHWYADAYNICCDEAHHDGTNHYVYRMVKPGRNIQNLYDKIMRGEQITSKSLSYYTNSLLPIAKKVYGW